MIKSSIILFLIFMCFVISFFLTTGLQQELYRIFATFIAGVYFVVLELERLRNRNHE